jgi:hypothetical protein
LISHADEKLAGLLPGKIMVGGDILRRIIEAVATIDRAIRVIHADTPDHGPHLATRSSRHRQTLR